MGAPRFEPAAIPLAEGKGWTGCGSGFSAYGDVLQQRLGDALSSLRPDIYPHARHIAMLAAPVFAAGQGLPAEQAAPVYVRDKVALKTAER